MKKLTEALKHGILLFLVALTLLPFLLVVLTAFKDSHQIFHNFWGWPDPVRWDNFSTAWARVSGYIWNTALVTVATVVGTLTVACFAAYAFARHNFPGKTLFFYMLLALMMIPGILSLVAAFVWMKQLHLLDTLWVLILPYIAGGQILAIFVLRSTFEQLPQDLFDAARLDGASEWQCLRHIALPLARPVLGTLAILATLGPWNDVVWPILTLSDPAKHTVAVGLRFFQGEFMINYGPLMAGYLIASIPLLLLFLLTMKTFIRGLTLGAMKA